MTLSELKETFEKKDKKLLTLLKDFYPQESSIDYQIERIKNALSAFEKTFPSVKENVSIFSSPGRTEIIGNHTDHQGGKAIAGAIDLDVLCIAGIRKTDSKSVELLSEGYDLLKVDLSDEKNLASERGTTKSLVKGILKGLTERGFKKGSFCCFMTSSVMQGSGLSSSAAFENAVCEIENEFYNHGKISPSQIALISAWAENQYFGKPSGVLDQMASSFGGLVKLDFYDKENPLVTELEVTPGDMDFSLCIVDTKGSHADLTEEYAAIPCEMRKVAGFFGKERLCEVEPFDLMEKLNEIRRMAGDRAVLRSMHFFSENYNVEKCEVSLTKATFSKKDFLASIKASGESSQKYLENIWSPKKVQNQELNLALAFTEKFIKDKGLTGATRVHGGGFAGTILVFLEKDVCEAYKIFIEKIFGEGSCHILNIRKAGSRKII